MQKLLNFLLIGLIFTVLQVTNVGAQDTAAPGSAASGQMDQDCAQLHPGGAATHVDPPESQIDAIEEEYKANCEAGNCFLSAATYASLESQGHSRGEVDCFMAEGERHHNEQHQGGDQNGQHHGQGNMNQGDPCMEAPAGPDRAACYAGQGNQNGQHHGQGNMNQGDPCMEAPAGPDRAACYATKRP